MVYYCLCCRKELTEKDVPIPVYETIDKWGTQRFRGKVCLSCKGNP